MRNKTCKDCRKYSGCIERDKGYPCKDFKERGEKDVRVSIRSNKGRRTY